MDQRTGKYAPFLLRNDEEIAYPEGSRILNFNEGETLTLFCHGTPKKPNFISMSTVGLDKDNSKSLSLTCKDKSFYDGDVQVSIDNIYSTTCTRIMEPLIDREESSDCSQGLGADGKLTDLENIVLVKVGWNFGTSFQEQVSVFVIAAQDQIKTQLSLVYHLH